MRKLPEAGSQLIREFKKKNGTFVTFGIAGLAPGDDALEGHSARSQAGMHMHHGYSQLRSEGEFPAACEAHSAFGNLHLSMNAYLDFRFIVQRYRASRGN